MTTPERADTAEPKVETLFASRVVTADAVHAPGWVQIAEGRITAVGAGEPHGGRGGPDRTLGRSAVRDLGDVTLVPGFVDLHSHGGGGGSFVGGDRESALAAAHTHRAHGTTAMMASLVTAPPEDLLRDVAMLADLIGADTRSGAAGGNGAAAGIGMAQMSSVRAIHLEGPWLSPKRAGAHAVDLLRDPDPIEIAALLEAARGAIRMVTIAPELPGAIDAIHQFVEAGVVVAIGHTDADYDTTRRAIDAGARVATHLFNAMRPLDHHEPGPILALTQDPRVSVELISDGVHVHPSLIAETRKAVGADRVLLVTDAMAAAGHEDGAYQLGGLDVQVRSGVARVAGTNTIAGSTATMDALFRSAVRGARAANDTAARGNSVPLVGQAGPKSHEDEALIAAVRQTATNPARVAGWHDVGEIAPGKRADFVVLDAELRVREVIPNL